MGTIGDDYHFAGATIAWERLGDNPFSRGPFRAMRAGSHCLAVNGWEAPDGDRCKKFCPKTARPAGGARDPRLPCHLRSAVGAPLPAERLSLGAARRLRH